MFDLDDAVATSQFARTIACLMLLILLIFRRQDVARDEFVPRSSKQALTGLIVFVAGVTMGGGFWTLRHLASAIDAHYVSGIIYNARIIGAAANMTMVAGVAIVFAAAAKTHVSRYGAVISALAAFASVAVGAWVVR